MYPVTDLFRHRMPRIVLLATVLVLPASAQNQPPGAEDHADMGSYTDSSTCMGCHSNSHRTDLMASTHWTWEHLDPASGQTLGKKHVINNFCVAVSSNEARCTSCHIGVGWRDMDVSPGTANSIDCLVCHDTTGTYRKDPKLAGEPVAGLDLVLIAQNAGLTSRQTCGACHFFGGGGDAVKHGDLDSTMTNPTRDLDVHMGTDGGNFSCTRCHKDSSTPGNSHDLVGTRYPTDTPDHMLCQKCHTGTPHESSRLNTHAERVACQTCHIPAFARGGMKNKESWDWSTAGDRNPDGSQKKITNAEGDVIYDSMKGSFSWKEKVVPDYRWFNGGVTFATLDDQVTEGEVLTINALQGDKDDPNARLFAVKRFTGRQPYDAGTGTLAVPHLFPTNAADTSAYWKGYDWDAALEAGQASVGRAWVGPMGVVDTEMFWIQNHMVAPKEKALHCSECHSAAARLDFAALGYAPEDAAALQNFFPVDEAVTMDTADAVSGVTLRWTAELTYFRYQVQSSDDLVTWNNEPDGLFVSEEAGQEFTFNRPMEAVTKKFYRVMRTR